MCGWAHWRRVEPKTIRKKRNDFRNCGTRKKRVRYISSNIYFPFSSLSLSLSLQFHWTSIMGTWTLFSNQWQLKTDKTIHYLKQKKKKSKKKIVLFLWTIIIFVLKSSFPLFLMCTIHGLTCGYLFASYRLSDINLWNAEVLVRTLIWFFLFVFWNFGFVSFFFLSIFLLFEVPSIRSRTNKIIHIICHRVILTELGQNDWKRIIFYVEYVCFVFHMRWDYWGSYGLALTLLFLALIAFKSIRN